MTSEKRVWLAAALSVLSIALYMNILGPKTQPSSPVAPRTFSTTQPEQVKPEQVVRDQIIQLLDKEDIIEIRNESVRLSIGKLSTAIREVSITHTKGQDSDKPPTFKPEQPITLLSLDDQEAGWVLSRDDRNGIEWTRSGVDRSEKLSMRLDERLPKAMITLSVLNLDESPTVVPVRLLSSWTRADGMNGRNNLLEAVLRTERQQWWQREYLKYVGGVGSERVVPRGTSQITLAERYFCQSIIPQTPVEATLIPTTSQHTTSSLRLETALAVSTRTETDYSFSIYFGPRDFFALRDAGFASAFPLGMLSQFGLVLIVVLKWIAGLTNSYGFSLILLSIGITLVLSPFTLASFRSMKKMQDLQPKLEQVKKKYQNDQVKLNKETFALFKEHKVSPMSGCLPMLLQIPIFFAVWSAISHFTEIRGEPFLWIKDLSLPDRLAMLPFGIELNILPIVMAAAMYLQTKMTQRHMPASGSNPTAKLFSGPLMSVMFGVMFYSFPSSLVLYWLSNTVTSLLFYRMAKA